MGWFGFGGSRSRDERARADARFKVLRTDARFVHDAVCIDRAGKPSRLLDERPRRRDREDRWDRR